MTETVRKQILAIRDTGATNMLAVRTVQALACRMGFFQLECFLDDRKGKDEYWNFIMYGDGRDDE